MKGFASKIMCCNLRCCKVNDRVMSIPMPSKTKTYKKNLLYLKAHRNLHNDVTVIYIKPDTNIRLNCMKYLRYSE